MASALNNTRAFGAASTAVGFAAVIMGACASAIVPLGVALAAPSAAPSPQTGVLVFGAALWALSLALFLFFHTLYVKALRAGAAAEGERFDARRAVELGAFKQAQKRDDAAYARSLKLAEERGMGVREATGAFNAWCEAGRPYCASDLAADREAHNALHHGEGDWEEVK